MRTLNGLSGPTPPPRMMGLELPTGMGIPTGAPTPPPVMPTRPAPAPPPGAFAPAAFPPLAPDKAQAYQTAFQQLDGDRDGLVQGVDCFPTLMRSGLPKETLKQIWDVVAGDEGHLNGHQFVQCLYLVDCAKMGIPIPATIPPGQFPPSQGGIGLQSMMGRSQTADIYTGQLYVPPMLPKSAYIPGQAPAVAFQSQVPGAPTPAQLSGLAAAEQARLAQEREEALRQEAERQRAEEERVAAAAKREFYTQALANLRVAQSKVARTLVEAQQRLEMERREAETMENQYNSAYEGFSTEHARAAPLLEALKKVEDEKADLTAKLAALQSAVAQLEEYDPEWESREAAECEGLKKDITALAVKHEVLQQTKAVATGKRENLQAAVSAVKDAVEKAQSSVDALIKETEGLSAETKKEGATVVALLQKLAPLYNDLYSAAKAAMVPLPKEALATIARPPASAFKYDPVRFGSTAVDWDVFTDEGFTITAVVVPDARLLSLTSTSLVQAEEGEKAEEGAEVAAEGGGEEGETTESVEGKKPDEEEAATPAVVGEVEKGDDPPTTAVAGKKEGDASTDDPPVTDPKESTNDPIIGSIRPEISLDDLTLGGGDESSTVPVPPTEVNTTGKGTTTEDVNLFADAVLVPEAEAEAATTTKSEAAPPAAASEPIELLLLGEETISPNGNTASK